MMYLKCIKTIMSNGGLILVVDVPLHPVIEMAAWFFLGAGEGKMARQDSDHASLWCSAGQRKMWAPMPCPMYSSLPYHRATFALKMSL